VTPTLLSTNVGTLVSAVYPGVPCALTGATMTSPGRCAGGAGSDQLYRPFTIGADEPVSIAFTAPIRRNAIARGAACNTGNVRVEEVDMAGTCTAVVPGTLMTHDRDLVFVPDQPWTAGKRYKLTLVSGNNQNCDTGGICGMQSAVNFDPLAGDEAGDAGGTGHGGSGIDARPARWRRNRKTQWAWSVRFVPWVTRPVRNRWRHRHRRRDSPFTG
jgi:hypothetical protein